jgi:nucleotide-binding universal stress UspA family protein
MRILLCTDGSPMAENAARLLSDLKLPLDSEMTILGVLVGGVDQVKLRAEADRLLQISEAAGFKVEIRLQTGKAAETILAEQRRGNHDLVAVGAHHPRLLERTRLGSTTARLLRDLNTPLLIAKEEGIPLRRILVCTSMVEPSLTTVAFGGRLAASAQADVSLLHVMSQVAMLPESPPLDLGATAETAISKHTREGEHLMAGLTALEAAGLQGRARAVLRHGLVLDEVLSEVAGGGYGLLIIGAHRQPGLSRLREMLLEDLASQIVWHAPCSVLVVRPPQAGVPPQ